VIAEERGLPAGSYFFAAFTCRIYDGETFRATRDANYFKS